MEIKKAVELIWNNRKYTTMDPKEAISHLNEEVAESLKALMKGDEDRAKRELEDALSCILIAFKVMDIDIEEAIYKQIKQMKRRHEQLMIINRIKLNFM